MENSHSSSSRTTEFRETDPSYYFLRIIHVKYIGFVGAFIGLLVTVGSFGLAMKEFPFLAMEVSFIIVSTLGMLVYLVLGILVNISIVWAICKIKFRWIMISICYNGFLVFLELITLFIALGDRVTQPIISNPSDERIRGRPSDDPEAAATLCLIVCPILIVGGFVWIYFLCKLRRFLRNKRRYIRNGLPPPVREVVLEGVVPSFRNKVNPSTGETETSSNTPSTSSNP